MALKMKLQLTGIGQVEVEIKPIDRVKFERESGVGIPQAIDPKRITEEFSLKLSWHAARRMKIVAPEMPFDDFLELVEDMDEEVSTDSPLGGTAEVASTA